MSFNARVFRALIASPSDVTEERELAVRTIQEWNDLNAAQRNVVLLPLRWETHAAPAFGRPQAVVNAQVVDHCDILIGIFWTRIGTPTGVSDSGSLEEIDRVASNGRPVMLYFSRVKQHPDDIDLDQLKKLREFKRKTYPNAYVESYSTPMEFRDKLARQLEIQLRTLLAEESGAATDESSIRPITDINLEFAKADSGERSGHSLRINATTIVMSDFDSLPDFELDEKVAAQNKPNRTEGLYSVLTWSLSNQSNKDYYRETALHLMLQSFFRPVRFWLKNSGGIGAQQVHVELTFRSEGQKFLLLPSGAVPNQQPSIMRQTALTGWHGYAAKPEDIAASASNTWTTTIELPALQPQREVSPVSTILIGAERSCDVHVNARIFADTLPQPQNVRLDLRLEVESLSLPAAKLLSALERGHSSAATPKSQPESPPSDSRKR